MKTLLQEEIKIYNHWKNIVMLCTLLFSVIALIVMIGCVARDKSSPILKEVHSSLFDSYNAVVTVDYGSIKHEISPLLYGNNTKWLYNGEAGFGRDNGMWSVNNNSINKKVEDFLADSGITILRYGDGSNADYFYWGWSILPLKERLKINLYTRWGDGEHYVFGIMEFIRMCESIKCEAILTLNYGMGLLEFFYDPKKQNDKRSKREIAIQQAINWVEFMNAPAPSYKDPVFPEKYKPEYSLQKMPEGYFAYLRKQLGHPETVGVKYWEVGNEIYNFHATGGRSARTEEMATVKPISMEEYVENTIEFSRRMKLVDPAIKVGIVKYPDLDKQLQMLKGIPETADFVILHDYIRGKGSGSNLTYALYGTRYGMRRNFSVQKDGKYSIRVHAWGRAYFGDKFPEEMGMPSQLEVKVDGSVTGRMTISKNIDYKKNIVNKKFYWYEIPISLSAGEHEIALRLSNDFFDPLSPDIDRRGRDIFMDSALIVGQGETYDISGTLPFAVYYSQISAFEKELINVQTLIKKYTPHMFIARTENAVYPPPHNLSAALGEALMLMIDMEYGVKIRNHWHIYGTCERGGVIHSGNARREYYHVTPSYFPAKMLSQHFGSTLLSNSVTSQELLLSGTSLSDIEEEKTTGKTNFPFLWASASRSPHKASIAMLNCHNSLKAVVRLDIQNYNWVRSVKHTLTSRDEKDFEATNEDIKENVFIHSEEENSRGSFVELPPNSFTILELYK